MSDQDQNTAEILARARRAWSPSAGDAERLRHAIGRALVTGRGAEASTGSPSHWATRVLLAGAIAAAGGAGYWAGHLAGVRDARAVMSADPSFAQGGPRAPAPAPAPAAVTLPKPQTREPPRSLLSPHEGDHGARLRGDGQTAAADNDSLAAEVLGLRNAERALREGNPGLAQAFLQKLDRQVPHGRLTEERDAAATLVRCARGDHPFGVDLAQDFTDRYPASVYRARVEQACRATEP